MASMLNPSEKRLFSMILESEAKQVGGEWFIDNEGPVSDMEKVLDALFEGKNVQMRYRDN